MSSFTKKATKLVDSSNVAGSSSSLSSPIPLPIPIPAPSPIRVCPPGVRPWLGSSFLCSSGCGDLDRALGGGLFVNSLTLLHEDTAGHFNHLTRAFLADGISHGHSTLFVTALAPEQAKTYITQLPRNVTLDKAAATASAAAASAPPSLADSADLKIAWRYNQYIDKVAARRAAEGKRSAEGQGPTKGAASLSHQYDYARTLSADILDKAPPTILSTTSLAHGDSPGALYGGLLVQLRSFLDSQRTASSRAFSRIVLHGLASFQWLFHEEGDASLFRFLLGLRALVLDVDCVLHWDSLDHDTVFTEFQALLTVAKHARLHSLLGLLPEAKQFLVKAKRKFQIEKLSLPPEISRNEEGQGQGASQAVAASSALKPAKAHGHGGSIAYEGGGSVGCSSAHAHHHHPHHELDF